MTTLHPLRPPLPHGTPHTAHPVSTGWIPPPPNHPLRLAVIKHAALHRHTISSPPPPFLSFTSRVSTPPLSLLSTCPRRMIGASLSPSEFEPPPLFLPLFGQLTTPTTVVLVVDPSSPLREPLKLYEPFPAVVDHQSVIAAVKQCRRPHFPTLVGATPPQ
jgi:hypothetical protein